MLTVHVLEIPPGFLLSDARSGELQLDTIGRFPATARCNRRIVYQNVNRFLSFPSQLLNRVLTRQIDKFITHVFIGRAVLNITNRLPCPVLVPAQQDKLVSGFRGDLQGNGLTDGAGCAR